jgi:hypothetical protein
MARRVDKLSLEQIIAGEGTIDRPFTSRSSKRIAERICCKDGTTLSVQVSYAHYCSPRENYGPYTHVEVGFPTACPPESWREYCEEGGESFARCPCNAVYAYVPVELVREFVESHGGEVK